MSSGLFASHSSTEEPVRNPDSRLLCVECELGVEYIPIDGRDGYEFQKICYVQEWDSNAIHAKATLQQNLLQLSHNV